MAEFKVHTYESAPERAKAFLKTAQTGEASSPEAMGVLAENPAVLDANLALSDRFREAGLSPAEQSVVLMAASVAHRCHFCVPSETARALKAGLDAPSVEAIRAGRPLGDPRLEALRKLTVQVIQGRGYVCDADLAAFEGAGWSRADALAVVLGVAFSTLGAYANRLAETPLTEDLARHAWRPAG